MNVITQCFKLSHIYGTILINPIDTAVCNQTVDLGIRNDLKTVTFRKAYNPVTNCYLLLIGEVCLDVVLPHVHF